MGAQRYSVRLVLGGLFVLQMSCDPVGHNGNEDGRTREATAVAEVLHDEGLVFDPEVNDSMRAAAARYQQRPETREAEAARLHAWITEWVRANPERAAAAREAAPRAREAAQ